MTRPLRALLAAAAFYCGRGLMRAGAGLMRWAVAQKAMLTAAAKGRR
jgi:hypothetical protein